MVPAAHGEPGIEEEEEEEAEFKSTKDKTEGTVVSEKAAGLTSTPAPYIVCGKCQILKWGNRSAMVCGPDV